MNFLPPMVMVGLVVTVILHLRVEPSFRVAVMVAAPYLRVVTMPLKVTVATALALVFQDLAVPFFTLRVTVLPALRLFFE